jgi:hypothetical protein
VPLCARRYKEVHARFGAPYKVVAPSKYRAVFVTDRMERPELPGPSNEGAAIIMGNSVRQWRAKYWARMRQTQVNEAVRDMEPYRAALLQQAEEDAQMQ